MGSYKPGGRARLSLTLLARNKRRSEPCSRYAARAALDLTSAAKHPPPKKALQRSRMKNPATYLRKVSKLLKSA